MKTNVLERFLKPEVAARLRDLEFVARSVVSGAYAGMHRSPHKGFSVEFSGHRAYAPGDDLKNVDWNILARTEKYYVKEFRAETNLRAYVVVDLSKSMDYKHTGEVTKAEYAKILAASFAYLLVSQNDPVGLITFDKEIREVREPRTRRSDFLALLECLADAPAGFRADLPKIIEEVSDIVDKRSLIVIFSDFLADLDRTVLALRKLRYRHEAVLFQIFDRSELELPFAGTTVFCDEETGKSVTADPERVRESFRREVEGFSDRLEAEAAKGRVDFARVMTDEPFEAALARLIRRRKLLR